MARSNFYDTIIDAVPTSPTYGKPISDNITITVYVAPPVAASQYSVLAQTYTASSGATTPGNPFTISVANNLGTVDFWVEPGTYDIRITDSTSPKRFKDKTIRFDAQPYVQGTIGANLEDTVAQAASANSINAANGAPVIRRGKSIIPTSEVRSSVSYGYLTTPDRVQNIVLPTDGLIWVMYSALWLNSVASAGRAAITLNGAIVQGRAGGIIQIQQATGGASATNYANLGTFLGAGVVQPMGLNGNSQLAAAPAADVTTGMFLGADGTMTAIGFVPIFAAAGTYEVGVQFGSTSGNVTVANRKLFVKAEGF